MDDKSGCLKDHEHYKLCLWSTTPIQANQLHIVTVHTQAIGKGCQVKTLIYIVYCSSTGTLRTRYMYVL